MGLSIELGILLQVNVPVILNIMTMEVMFYANLAITNGLLILNLFFIVMNVLKAQPIVLVVMI